MTEAVFRRFPDHIEVIKLIIQENRAFRELCADYEEASALLASHFRSEGLASKRRDHIRELIRDLEEEILRALGDAES